MSCVLVLTMAGLLLATDGAPGGLGGELIFPLQPQHAHGSSLVECPNGDLLACWFQGSGERSADDVRILGARLRKGASSWSAPFLMADTPGFPDCNPVMFIDKDRRLWMFWIVVQDHRWEKSLLKYRRAERYENDGPPRWSWQDIILLKPGDDFVKTMKDGLKELIPDEGMWAEYAPPYSRMIEEASQDPAKRQMGWMTRIHPCVLPSGRILLPLYSDGFNTSLMAISDDMCESWRPSLPIVGLGPIQPTVVPRRDGTLVAYLRDSGGPPNRVMMSTSKDSGESWSLARDTSIPNPGSSLEAIVLRDGRWLMVYNDTEDGRHSLAVSVSDDEGTTWKWTKHIEQAANGEASFAYPSVIQTRDGRVHATYSCSRKDAKSIKHATLDAEWVAGK